MWWCCLRELDRTAFILFWLAYNPAGFSYVRKSDYDAYWASWGVGEGDPEYNTWLIMAMWSIGEVVIPDEGVVDVFFFNEPRGAAVWAHIALTGGACSEPCKLLTFPT